MVMGTEVVVVVPVDVGVSSDIASLEGLLYGQIKEPRTEGGWGFAARLKIQTEGRGAVSMRKKGCS